MKPGENLLRSRFDRGKGRAARCYFSYKEIYKSN